MCRWSEEQHHQVEYELAAAFHDGWCSALAHVAAQHAELDATWHPLGARNYEHNITDRVADFERCARELADRIYGGEWWI